MEANHILHLRLKQRENARPHLTNHERVGLNGKIGLFITNVVGAMWCAYVFAVLTLVSFPAAFEGGAATLIAWIGQTFLPLVLLSVILVGQKVAAIGPISRHSKPIRTLRLS